jgi:hypothetical protein
MSTHLLSDLLIDTILFDNFLDRINRDKTSELNIWIGDAHNLPDGIKLLVTLARLALHLSTNEWHQPMQVHCLLFLKFLT